jgi:catechol 2,3-dioxygenase-like lactoylglutathione lyase family enzyme
MLDYISATPMVAVKDLARARRFYEGTLGLEPLETGVSDVIRYRAGGGIFVVYVSQFAGSNRATALTWTVGNELERKIEALKAKGITFERYEMPETKHEGDVHVSGEMRNAWFKDPDGNIHALSNR